MTISDAQNTQPKWTPLRLTTAALVGLATCVSNPLQVRAETITVWNGPESMPWNHSRDVQVCTKGSDFNFQCFAMPNMTQVGEADGRFVPREAPPVIEAPKPFNRDLCKQMNGAAICEGNRGIPRDQMPQVEGSAKEKCFEKLRAKGIEIKRETVPPHQMTNTQGEINKTKTFGMLRAANQGTYNPCGDAVISGLDPDSGDRFVIDGHHRKVACQLAGGNQLTDVIYHADAFELILECQGLRRADLNDRPA